MWDRRIKMELQLKFETVPVFHWNDQSELDEKEIMRRVEERRINMEFYYDMMTWQYEMMGLLLCESPIKDYLVNGAHVSHEYNGSGDKIEVSVIFDFNTFGDVTGLSNKLNEASEYLRELLMNYLPAYDLGLDTGILSNPDENGDEFWVGVTCDPNNTQCTIEIIEE